MTEIEVEESLVTRRLKRSTAGNRMQAALAEMSIDDLTHDAEEDVDFIVKVDEEDAFESDFASTEEDEGADEEAGEKTLEEEERIARRAARQKIWKTPKLPRRVAFESPAQDDKDMVTAPSSVKSKLKPNRRVSLGQIIDAETGEIMETPLGKRKSTREATRINTQEVQSRIKDAENRRVSVTKRPKEVKRRKTQADLIAAALDLEEGNIKSHREYLAVEEERRKKARVVKPVTVGPKVRWRSKIEDVTVTVYDPAPPIVPSPAYPPPPTWPTPYTSTAPYNPYIPSPFPGQPSPAPPSFPYASYNIPPPFPLPLSTTTVPAVDASTPTSPAGLPSPSTPAPLFKALSSTQDPTTATPAPPAAPAPAPAPAPTPTSPAVPPSPQPSTSAPPPSDPAPATPPVSSASIPPPSMPPRVLPPAPPSARPKTPPKPSTAGAPATPVASTSTSSAIPPVSTPTPAPGTLNGTTSFPPPSTTPGFPYPYPGYYPYPYYTPTPANRTGQPQVPYPSYTPYYPYTPSPVGQYSATRQPHLQLQPPQQIPRKTTEKQTKNYVEVLLNEERPKDKPSWRETMDAMFGKHADWDNVRVYVGKNRPSTRQIQVCPITGLSARYRDPRSGVPYANLGAFRILSRLLAHEYVWSPNGAPSGVFVGHEKQRGAIGVPDNWADAMAGIPPKQPEHPPPPPPPKHEEKAKKETKAKESQRTQKEIRVGERRSSRIAAEATGSSASVAPSAPITDNSLRGTDKMNAE